MRNAVITGFTAALLAVLAQGALASEAPQRIVSINMCTDELLLALADPGQIVALSPYAADPAMSFLADKAVHYRHDAAEAETVVALHPDLVLAGSFNDPATLAMLTRLGYRLALLDAPRSIDESIAQIRKVAALIGHAGARRGACRQDRGGAQGRDRRRQCPTASDRGRLSAARLCHRRRHADRRTAFDRRLQQ